MLKYVNTGVVFQEIPDEVTLAVNISSCPCHCPGCHSQYLWGDIGLPLTTDAIDALVEKNGRNITCLSFMGGDAEPRRINRLAHYIREEHPGLKVAWYTGRTHLSPEIDREAFDYVKIGPYLQHLGPLNKPTTNQRLYRNNRTQTDYGTSLGPGWQDITSRFWRK